MIKVYHPRYHDSVVLLARWKLTSGRDVKFRILYGAYKGLYKVTNEVICRSKIEPFITKNGRKIEVRAVPLNEIERIEE